MKTRMVAFFMTLAIALAGTSAFASTHTIQDIQLGLVDENTDVTVCDVVVTAVGAFGFFIQEVEEDGKYGRKWSGIWVYTAANNGGVQEGDIVTVDGEYYEYFDFSEIDLTGGSWFKTGDGTVPDPVDVTLAEVNNDGIDAEAYESVFIKVDRDDATLYAYEPDANNEWYIRTNSDGTGDSLLIETYSGFDYNIPDPGTEISFLAGIHTYSFSNYKLAPRDCIRDIGGPCAPYLDGAYATSNTTIDLAFGVPLDSFHEDPSNYELDSFTTILSATLTAPNIVTLTTDPLTPGAPETVTCFESLGDNGIEGPQDQSSSFRAGITPIRTIQEVANPAVDDASPLFGEVVTIQGTLTAIEGTYYYLQDDDGGEWDGIYARIAGDGARAIGDIVQVSGLVTEFFGATQLAFQQGVNNWQNFGPNPAPVVINDVTAADIPYNNTDLSNTAEPWEFCPVRVTAGVIDTMGIGVPAFGEYELLQSAGADTAGADFGQFQIFYQPCVGDTVTVSGILRYEFSQYRIASRDDDDIVVIFGCNAADVPGDGLTVSLVELQQNAPNPFRGETQIRLRLQNATPIEVEVLDVSGRLVKTLANGDFAAGEHVLNWDGRSESGDLVAAGTYFYRLRANGDEFARKMLMVK